MPIKWIVFFVALWGFGAIFSGLIENVFLGGTTESVFETLMSFNITKDATIFGVFTIPVPNAEWVKALGKMFVWDFAVFEGDYAIFRHLMLVPISIGMGVTFAITLMQIARGS